MTTSAPVASPKPKTGEGHFITFEGVEGAGKSTQARMLADWLQSLGQNVVLTREPGGSPAAESLRNLLLSGAVEPFGADAEALVFALARADHMAETIRPALQSGQWVICDRFMDSTRVYQGVAGVSGKELDRLEQLAVGPDRPELTLIVDVPAEEGLARIDSRAEARDRFEAEELDVHRARRKAFLDIAEREPDRCRIVESTGSADDTALRIQGMVAERFDLRDRSVS